MVYKVLLFTLVVEEVIVQPNVNAVLSAVDARAKVTACGLGEADGAKERADTRCEEEEDEDGRQKWRCSPDRCSVARELLTKVLTDTIRLEISHGVQSRTRTLANGPWS